MNLSISNIAWSEIYDQEIYETMQQNGFTGLEIAPTRIFPISPYEKIDEAQKWFKEINTKYGFVISSMQSIWYGRNEKIFGSKEERELLFLYTKKAIDFASALNCNNLVFGCPKNRVIAKPEQYMVGVDFFRRLGEYAASKGTCIGMEANPPIYNTNYINRTQEAIELIRQVNSDGFKLNLDIGTMIENGESIDILKGNQDIINHIHISEPGLRQIEYRDIHKELREFLLQFKYDGYISIEMAKQDDINKIIKIMVYLHELFFNSEVGIG